VTSSMAAGAAGPRLLVTGGRRLVGQVAVSGAKNSALKLMAASLLAQGVSVLHNVPDIQDVRTMQEVLEYLGALVEFADGTITVDTTAVQSHVAPYELVQRMRASIQIMGPRSWAPWLRGSGGPGWLCPVVVTWGLVRSISTCAAWLQWAEWCGRITVLLK